MPDTAGLDIEVKILDPRLKEWGLPRYQSDMAAAIDLYACVDQPTVLSSSTAPVLISTGLSFNMGRSDMAGIVLPRSGLGHKSGLVLGNLVGLIDPDYTGPVMVSAWNRSPPGGAPIVIQPGDRFAQMMFVPILRPAFTVVEEFSTETTRGAGGFGSTG